MQGILRFFYDYEFFRVVYGNNNAVSLVYQKTEAFLIHIIYNCYGA